MDRQVGVAEHEAAQDFRAAGDRLQRYCLDLVANPGVRRVVQDRTGAKNGAQGTKIEPATGRQARILAELQVRRAGAEDGDPLVLHDAPQRSGIADGPVVQNDLAAGRQR